MNKNEAVNIAFDKCYLDRYSIAKDIIEPILSNQNDPICLTINGNWGSGKTTFLKMFEKYLTTDIPELNYDVIYFNAWETDFIDDPFLALFSELYKDTVEETSNKDFIKKLIKSTTFNTAKILTYLLPPGLDKLANSGIDAIKEISEINTNDVINEYNEIKKSIEAFREFLSTKQKSNNEKPLIFIIDELDRCRPTYAVTLLERVKHLFCAKGIHFIFGIDIEQLSHSVGTMYGDNCDTSGYLRRFFDLEYTLPSPNIKEYIRRTFDRKIMLEMSDLNLGQRYLIELIQNFNLSLRDIDKLFLRLELLSFNNNFYDDVGYYFILLIILKIKDSELYNSIIKGNITGNDLICKIDDKLDLKFKEIKLILKIYAFIHLGYKDNKVVIPIKEQIPSILNLIEFTDENERFSDTNIRNTENRISSCIKNIELTENLKKY